MCKFCENKNTVIKQFDNHNYEETHYGSFFGLGLNTTIELNGNCLSVKTDAEEVAPKGWRRLPNRNKRSDGTLTDPAIGYVKLNFCPFCGRKLESGEYESLENDEKREKLNMKIQKLETELNSLKILAHFTYLYKPEDLVKRDDLFYLSEQDCSKAVSKKLEICKCANSYGFREYVHGIREHIHGKSELYFRETPIDFVTEGGLVPLSTGSMAFSQDTLKQVLNELSQELTDSEKEFVESVAQKEKEIIKELDEARTELESLK